MGFLLSNYQKRKSICKNGTSSIKRTCGTLKLEKLYEMAQLAKTT